MIGTSLLHYEITAKLGEGGMGEVYRARDGRLGRDVAIKVLPEAFLADAERLARFEREAQLLASLNHPNIGAIYGLEEAEEKRFLVLELIEGDTLEELIKKGVPLERGLEIAAQIARALETAHEQGIVHRDLKPANVKVTPDGSVKVLDFGLAKAWAPAPGDPHISASPTLTVQMTQAGVILGTAAYMSPEQARGQEVDKRADIWAFGVFVFEMLTGEGLFGGDTVTDTLAAVVRSDPDWEALPRRTPRRARELLERCLEKDPQLRLRDIGEARIVFESAEPEVQAEATDGAVPVAPSRFAWAPWAVAALAVLVAVLAALGILPPRAEAPRPTVRLQAEIATGLRLEDGGPDFAFSPDGRSMAIAAITEAGRSLFVRDLESLEARELSGTSNAWTPFYSPDGEWIGYFADRGMRKVSTRGGAPLTLADEVSQARGGSWSEDGFIYYTPGTTTGIWRVTAEGGGREQLTEPSAEAPAERSHRWPQALPDGRSVLMTVQPQGSNFNDANLAVLDLATREIEIVHRGGSMGRYLPTGHLVFVREGTLYAAPFDLEAREIRRPPAPVLEGVVFGPGYGGADFATSPGGTLIYLEGEAEALGQLELLRVQPDGTAEPLSATRRAYRNPRISPDEATVLFVDAPQAANQDIWSLDLERDVATRLTFDETGDFGPVWSPDGTRFAFASRRAGQANIWVKRVEGTSEAEPLTTEGGLFQVPMDWSPDGRHILFFQVDAGANVYTLDVGTLEVEPYLDSEFEEGSSKFAPNGRWVAFRSDESGRDEVYIRPFPLAAGKWQVSAGGGSEPVWSSDGRVVYYRGDDRKLYAADVTEEGSSLRVGSPRPVFEDRYRRGPGRGYDIASDGSFVFTSGSEQSDQEAGLPILVFNWFEELKRLVPLDR